MLSGCCSLPVSPRPRSPPGAVSPTVSPSTGAGGYGKVLQVGQVLGKHLTPGVVLTGGGRGGFQAALGGKQGCWERDYFLEIAFG